MGNWRERKEREFENVIDKFFDLSIYALVMYDVIWWEMVRNEKKYNSFYHVWFIS